MDFVDNYFNVTFDTVMALKFTLNTIRSGQLQNLQFLMIADDDTYINVDALVKNLLEQNSILKPVGNYYIYKHNQLSPFA